jgi:hypothetical protein
MVREVSRDPTARFETPREDDERDPEPDEAPETPPDEPAPVPVQDPPAESDQRGPYVVSAW